MRTDLHSQGRKNKPHESNLLERERVTRVDSSALATPIMAKSKRNAPGFAPILCPSFRTTSACRGLPQLPHAMEAPPQAQPDRGTNDSSWRVRWQRLNGFVCGARPRFQKKGWRVDPASAQANAGGRTRLSGAGQRPRSTADCATGHFHTEGRPRVPPDCLPLKSRPVRRAHHLTVVLLPKSIVKKRTEEMDPKLASSISHLSWCLANRGFGGYRLCD